jgi:hypothetical protein
MVVIKRPVPLDPTIPLQNQLQVISFPGAASRTGQEASYFEILYNSVRHAISPYFDACTRGETDQTLRRGKGVDEVKTGDLLLKILVNSRNSLGKEENRRAGVVVPASSAECRNTRNYPSYPDTCSKCDHTSNSYFFHILMSRRRLRTFGLPRLYCLKISFPIPGSSIRSRAQ